MNSYGKISLHNALIQYSIKAIYFKPWCPTKGMLQGERRAGRVWRPESAGGSHKQCAQAVDPYGNFWNEQMAITNQRAPLP